MRGSGKGLVPVELDVIGGIWAVDLDGGSETEIMGDLIVGSDSWGLETEKVGTFVFAGSDIDISGVLASDLEKENVGMLGLGCSLTEILGILWLEGLVFKDALPLVFGGSGTAIVGVLVSDLRDSGTVIEGMSGTLILGIFTDAE